jgi:hypothetical protein
VGEGGRTIPDDLRDEAAASLRVREHVRLPADQPPDQAHDGLVLSSRGDGRTGELLDQVAD